MQFQASLLQRLTTGMSKVTLMQVEPLISHEYEHQPATFSCKQAPSRKRESILLDLGIV